MPHLKSTLVRTSSACALVLTTLLAQAATPASAVAVNHTVDIEKPAPVSAVSAVSAVSPVSRSPAHPWVGDDPVAIRDTLAKQNLSVAPPSLSDRVRNLIHIPGHKQRPDSSLTAAHLDRDLTFVLPVSHGLRYQAKTHLLTVDVDLSSEGDTAGIVLRKTTSGPSGRGLAVAPEAKSKGFIQHVEVIELEPGESKKTTIRGRVMLSRAAYDEANDDFAIVLLGRLTPPYLVDRSIHRDPDDEDPTDITTRTSRLYVDLHAIWLVSPQRGIVLSKTLHLSE